MRTARKTDKKRTVLITGLTGFVGSHLTDYILAKAPEYTIVGLARWRSPKDNVKHILDKVTLEYGDMTDFPSVHAALAKYRPEFIFHLAAQSYVDFSFVAPIATLESNVIGTATLLEAVRVLKAQSGYDPIIHVCSSSEVYGQVKEN